MRAATAAELAVLHSGSRSERVRVSIKNGVGAFVDLTDQGGVDWVDSVRWTETTDAAVGTADVVLAGFSDGQYISTLMINAVLNSPGGVYAPLLNVNREIYIETAVTAYGVAPVSGDWKEVFRGRCDEIDLAQPDKITLKCRDLGGLLVDTFIETIRQYGTTPTGIDIETVIQNILDDNINTPSLGSVTLYSVNGTGATPFNPADTPSFKILRYEQAQQSVRESIEALVKLIGYTCRYQWHANTAAFQLVLSEPDRAKTTPDVTFANGEWYGFAPLSISRAGIRNAIAVTYYDKSLSYASRVVATDATSIAKYGRLYMGVSQGAASAIDTSTEATALATKWLSDLSEPSAIASIRLDYFWTAERGDMNRFAPDAVTFDQNLDLATVSISHQIAGGSGETTLTLRGKPTGGFDRWLRVGEDLNLTVVHQRAIGFGQIESIGFNASVNGSFSQNIRMLR